MSQRDQTITKHLSLWTVLSLVGILLWGCGSEDSIGPSGIGPEGGTVTSSDGKASVIIPQGALSQKTSITVNTISGVPSGNIGTAYEFSPEGITFSQPVIISSRYDVATLPSGISEADLKLGTLGNNVWQAVTNSTVDTVANVVSGTTMSFSVYSIIVPSIPSAPIIVTAVSGNSSVTITWNAVLNATSYNLYMASQSGVTKINYADLPDGMKHAGVSSPFAHTGLTNGKTYYFVVTAVNSNRESTESKEVSAHPFIVDQVNVAFTPTVFGSIQFASPVGQEFTPTLSSLDVVELFTTDFGNGPNGIGAELVVNIRHDTITNPIIATSLPFTLPDSFSGITHFDFPSSVPLTPGELYVIEVTVVSGDNWGIGGSSVPTCASGRAIGQGVPITCAGLWFQEGIIVLSEQPQVPSAPTGVTAVPGDGTVAITWDAVPNATSYHLYMASQSGVTKSNHAVLSDGMKHLGVSIPFIHTGLTNFKTYYFVITAVNAEGESVESSVVLATPTALGGNACMDFLALATAEEIAKTPKENAEAEQLALEATSAFIAPHDVYERVVGELAAIRAAYPVVADIRAMPSWAAHDLIVGFDDSGEIAVQQGSYTAWDCPNSLYGVTEVDKGLLNSLGTVILRFAGRFNIPLLKNEYDKLSNVRYTEPNHLMGDGNDVCLSIEGTMHFIVFDAGSGDCPAGCTNHKYWGFSVGEASNITELGTWESGFQSPQPIWFQLLSTCTKWL